MLWHFFLLINFSLAQLVNTNTITVSSTTYRDYVSSRTVDGNLDQNASSCSHTDVRWDITAAWLRIDLGGVYSVKSVKTWHRGDSKYHLISFLNGTM